jgi:hypothetical protein
MLQRKPDVQAIEGLISVISDPAAASLATDLANGSSAESDPALNLERIAAEALDQLRQLSHEHASLSGQVLTLERQVRTLLIERLELSAQIASLQRENAQLRNARINSIAPATRPTPLPRHEPITPLRNGFGTAQRLPQPVGDEERLLSNETPPDAPAPPAERQAVEQAPASYILIAQPFGRFSDLGRFQTAIQDLRGVQNARVRRFAQGTLEMRLDYDGRTPLQEALKSLALAVEAVEQIEPHRLIIRLRPDSLV